MLSYPYMRIYGYNTTRELVKTYKALSDESRLRVLNLILERECCVCELVQALEIPQSRASRILGVLHNSGFLKLRKMGLWSLYSIDWEGMPSYLTRILEAAQEGFRHNKQMEIDLDRFRKAERIGPGCIGKVCKASPVTD